jgi:hypothetical protein
VVEGLALTGFRTLNTEQSLINPVGISKLTASRTEEQLSLFLKTLIIKTASRQGCTQPVRLAARTAKFCTVVPNICGPSVWNLLHIILLSPRMLKWPLQFWKRCAPLHQGWWCRDGSVYKFNSNVSQLLSRTLIKICYSTYLQIIIIIIIIILLLLLLLKYIPCARHEGIWGNWGVAPLIDNLGTRWSWVVSLKPSPLYSSYPLNGRLDRPQRRSGRWEKEKKIIHCPVHSPVSVPSRRISGPTKGDVTTGGQKTCIMHSFIICTLCQILSEW